jgi:sugar O-acyltransferase (sialic acid O-acetyltransferase NeuD family)
MDKIILVGGIQEIIELCEVCGKDIIGIIDKNVKNNYLGYKILGTDDIAHDLFKEYRDIPLIITPDLPEVRKKLFIYYFKIGFKFNSLIHPNASISRSSSIGEGVVINSYVNISANVTLGNFVRINTGANIMHDSKIGKFSTVAPSAVILGRVNILDSCYIGSNSTILPDISIDNHAVVGAGAVVTRNVREKSTVLGNPAKLLKN